MDIAIFGAQGIALSFYKALRKLSNVDVKCFLVTSLAGNPCNIDDIPVLELTGGNGCLNGIDREKTEVYIATPENVQYEIEEVLENNGFSRHHRIISDKYAAIMELYYATLGEFPLLRSKLVGSKFSFARCLVSLSEYDKPLRDRVVFEDWMEPIQVGSVLGDRIIANLRDDTGNNISYKNENYSELTALYWLWKNRLCGRGGENVYYGLMQYRRRLMIAKDDLYRLEANGVDAVLPYPMIYEPNISVHPKRYLRDNDLKNLLTALDELQPLYAEAASTILLQPYFYNYNIILARKSVLADYCNWLFPILGRVEELNAYNGTERADRYIGYMGELLETLYFMYHKEDLCLAHTGCKFYV